jgi:hypothetical protein
MINPAYELEVASGWTGDQITEQRLYRAAAQIVPGNPIPSRPEDVVSLADLEERATAGGYIRGLVRSDRCAVVVHEAELAVADPLHGWLGDQSIELAALDPGDTLGGWYQQRAERLRAICVVGTQIPWNEILTLQQAGVLVSRLPFGCSMQTSRWVDYTTQRWSLETEVRRRAWIVAPGDDLFTQRLKRFLLDPLCDVFRELGFAHELQEPPGPHEEVGLVVLLTHGDEVTGAPVIDSHTRDCVLAACAQGAIIIHLGCHGAGRTAGNRYGDLARRLGVPQLQVPFDTYAAFARDCLQAGSTAMMAHLDATWSKTFEGRAVLIDAIEAIAEGTATIGYATQMLANEANRCGRVAAERRHVGDVLASGQAWLRYLDLSGFVCLGDVAGYVRWRDDAPSALGSR